MLAQAVTYVACAPKSNAAYLGIDKALETVRTTKTAAIPPYLQDAHYKGAAKLGHGIGYKYAHDYKNHYVNQRYLPDDLKDSVFYDIGDLGYEAKMKALQKKIKEEAQEKEEV